MKATVGHVLIVFTHPHGALGAGTRRLERISGQGGDDDVEGIFADKARGVDGGAPFRFGLGGPRGAIAVCDAVDGAPTASNVPRWMLSQTV